MTIKQFLIAFGLKPSEYNNLTKEEKKIVAQEYLKVKNSKQNHNEIFEEIINVL